MSKRDVQACATPRNARPLTRDEQGSGSSPLVGLFFFQGWAQPTSRPDAGLFAEGAREVGLYPVAVHAGYLINPASQLPKHRERSAKVVALELAAAGAIGADVVVVHPGSHGRDGAEEGMARFVEGLKGARDLAGPDAAEPVVESSVGARTQLCTTFEGLARVAERAEVRVCADTAHAFVAGYDLSSPKGAATVGGELRGCSGT